jgi:nitrite reductase/ring-hydroxylating ferredoxin subunit
MSKDRSTISRWWPLALSEEISSTEPIARRCGDQEYVLFRDRAGVAHALDDRCAHRRVPLSLGRVTENGALQCGYHGWCFDGTTGQCVAITTLDPSERVPARYKVPAFAVRERDGFVYVWDGAREEASEESLPTYESRSGEAGVGKGLCAVTHDAFVGTLIDAPGLILNFEGLVILPELLGEVQVLPGGMLTEYAMATHVPENRTQSPTDFPFVLRIAALAGTGQSEVSVWSLDESCRFSAVIAAEPARPWVTALRWRSWSSPSAGANFAFSLRTTIDPAGLMGLRAMPASEKWNELSRSERQRGVR